VYDTKLPQFGTLILVINWFLLFFSYLVLEFVIGLIWYENRDGSSLTK